jgi:CheY-like chemotaxis protein
MKRVCLMIVEDNPDVRRVIRRIVSDVATEIVECDDGAEALAAYARSRPDWVLMDIAMGEVDGIAATRQLTEAFPDARVVIVTGHDDEPLRTAAREAGACGYVLKENLFDLRRVLQQLP